MSRSLPAGGVLLLAIGFIGLSGFLTGNLDRWLGQLFSAGTGAKTGTASGASTSLPTVGSQATGSTA